MVASAMSVSDIRLNLFDYQYLCIGAEQTPVILIDNAINNIQDLIDFACKNNQFSTGQRTAYPGIRCALPEQFSAVVIEKLLPVIRHTYNLSATAIPKQYYGLYSLVTTAEQDLKVLQRVPHCDSRDASYFAIMCYLNAAPHGGTGFYRHNPTGYERITNERFSHYVAMAESFMAQHGLPSANYYRANDGHFSLVGNVDYQPNRLMVYPGNLLHSGLIDPVMDISSDPRSGRLTANIFVAFD